jgi:hypothetical protein
MTQNLIMVGVLFLGGFVGFVLALALTFSSTLQLKAAVAVLGAALAGAPVAFLTGVGAERWVYPVGLVLGLAWSRMLSARVQLAAPKPKRSPTHVLAWVDMVAIAAITLVVVLCAAFLKV